MRKDDEERLRNLIIFDLWATDREMADIPLPLIALALVLLLVACAVTSYCQGG